MLAAMPVILRPLRLVIRIHSRAPINVKTGLDDFEVESSIGVRQVSWKGLILSFGRLYCGRLRYVLNSSIDLELGASYRFNHLRRFGLTMHIGVATSLSKTVSIYFLPTRADYKTADASSFDKRDADGFAFGFVDFKKEFKNLGSIIYS